jgi:hypothetical protein
MRIGHEQCPSSKQRRLLRRVWATTLLLLAWALLHPVSGLCSGKWHVEVVDNGAGHDVGRYSSLAIDRFGDFHVAYYDQTARALRYAYRGKSDSRWYTMEVDQLAGTYLSLAVDAQGYPHVAYNSEYETGLHYAYWDGKNWHRMIIDPVRTDRFANLQLDAAGHPHISYYRENYGANQYALYLKYAFFDGKTWYVQAVDHHWGAGKANSIALDSNGRPWIAYSVSDAQDLAYAHWDGSRWQYGMADTRAANKTDYVGMANSIAVDAQDQPHIAYLDGTRALLKYAWEDRGVWHSEVVDQLNALEGDWDHVSLKLDHEGNPHIAYYDAGLGALKYAYKDGKGWHVDVVDDQGNVGEYPSLYLDVQGVPYISYYDVTDGQLKLAYFETTAEASGAPNAKP